MFRCLFKAVLALLLSAASADAWTRITTEAQFRSQVADRLQVDTEGRGTAIFAGDGTVSGEWQGQRLRGRWQWHEGFLCRNLVIGSRETGTNCLRMEIRGSQLRGTQDQGRGSATITTLE